MTHPMGDFELIPVKEARAMRARVAELVEAYAARIVELEAQRAENARLRAALAPSDPDLVADYVWDAIGHLEWDAPAVAYVDALLAAIRKRAGLDDTQQTTEPPGGK